MVAMRMMQPLTVILCYEEHVPDVPEEDELGDRYEDDAAPHRHPCHVLQGKPCPPVVQVKGTVSRIAEFIKTLLEGIKWRLINTLDF